jgi:cystathionine beta-lyase/cystathionine gamma-synthase
VRTLYLAYNELSPHPDFERVNHKYNFLNPEHQDVYTQTGSSGLLSGEIKNKQEQTTSRGTFEKISDGESQKYHKPF